MLEGSARRQSGSAPPKKACVCSRTSFHTFCDSSAEPPTFCAAARTAGSDPESRTRSLPRCQSVADTGSGWPAQRFIVSIAASSAISSARVASDAGRGSTFSETSAISPSVPSDPAASRETS